MKDSSKLLHFNCDRELNFDPYRKISFDSQRDLLFNPNRKLLFDVNRDLGIRTRGVVFRGYVCPVCGASVAKDAVECDECFVRFKPVSDREGKKETFWDRGRKVSRPERESPRPSKKESTPSRSKKTFACPVCGNMLHTGAEVCPECGLEFTLGKDEVKKARKPKPPSQPVCHSCGFKIPKGDRFCRRCGKPVSDGATTVSWDEYKTRGRKDGVVSWEDYASHHGDKEDNRWS